MYNTNIDFDKIKSMHDWEDVQVVLRKQHINEQEAKILEDFLLALGFNERQRLMGVLLGFPEKCAFFVELLKKKKSLAESDESSMKDEIMNEEKNFLKELLIDAQK
ncbi:MAG: hypothetical protein ACD_67C00043G0004 [uncultured bacterium]|nr:MAG: hypothetical protein ACD_67C00043G0004 [uncultured bacterium]